MPVRMYACSVCGSLYAKRGLAVVCEARGRRRAKFRTGKTFSLLHQSGKRAKILGHRVIVHQGLHSIKYHIDWAGRETYLLEESVLESVEKGWWTPE